MQRPKMYLQIGGYFGVPEYPPTGCNILSEVDWRPASRLNNGSGAPVARNIQRFKLNKFDADDLEDRKQRALGLTYTTKARNSKLTEWEQIITAEEKAQRAFVLNEYTTAKAELESKPESDRTTEEKSRLVDIKQKIEDLSYSNGVIATGKAFLDNPPNGFGDGAACLYQTLDVPNIPFEFRSTFNIEEDEPFTLWLQRFKPQEEQENPELSIEFGPYRLTWEDNSLSLVKFNTTVYEAGSKKRIPLTPTVRKGLETALEQLKDEGRLTAADKRTIEGHKDSIKGIKAGIKKAGRKTSEITPAEQAQIDSHEKAVADLTEKKKRVPSATATLINELEDALFQDKTTVTLNETSESLYGVPIRVTFIPQRAGYLIINLEGSTAPFIYEDRKVIEEYHATGKLQNMWKRTGFTIKGNGGALMWNVGNPVFAEEGTLTTNAFPWGDLESDYSINTVSDVPGGCEITIEVQPEAGTSVSLNGHSATKGPTASAVITFTSDGKRTPFLFGANIYQPAGERTGDNGSIGNIVWDSEDYENLQGCILEVAPTHEEGRVSFDVTLLNPNGTLNLPANLSGRLCHIQCDDPDNPGQKISLIKNGILKTIDPSDLASFDASGPEMAEGSTVRLVVNDYFSLLEEDTIHETVIGDGQYLAEHIYNVLAGRGFYEGELAGLAQNLGKMLPQGLAYQKPLVQPSEGTDRASYVLGLLDTYGMKLELRIRDGVFYLEYPSTTPVAAFTSDGLGGATSSRHIIFAPLNRAIDDTDFRNHFRVEGGIDRATKQRIVMEFEISESIYKHGHPNYIGRRKSHILRDDALTKPDDVRWALRSLKERMGKTGRYVQWETLFHPKLRVGQWITINGVPAEIVRIPSASWADDSMTLQVRTDS